MGSVPHTINHHDPDLSRLWFRERGVGKNRAPKRFVRSIIIIRPIQPACFPLFAASADSG